MYIYTSFELFYTSCFLKDGGGFGIQISPIKNFLSGLPFVFYRMKDPGKLNTFCGGTCYFKCM